MESRLKETFTQKNSFFFKTTHKTSSMSLILTHGRIGMSNIIDRAGGAGTTIPDLGQTKILSFMVQALYSVIPETWPRAMALATAAMVYAMAYPWPGLPVAYPMAYLDYYITTVFEVVSN